jgi:hypothetical protein
MKTEILRNRSHVWAPEMDCGSISVSQVVLPSPLGTDWVHTTIDRQSCHARALFSMLAFESHLYCCFGDAHKAQLSVILGQETSHIFLPALL